MQPFRSPQEAYRRVDFDARVAGADARQLVALCYEQLTGALGSALYAAQCGDNHLKSQSLTRALSALTALTMGVDAGQAINANACMVLFQRARHRLRRAEADAHASQRTRTSAGRCTSVCTLRSAAMRLRMVWSNTTTSRAPVCRLTKAAT